MGCARRLPHFAFGALGVLAAAAGCARPAARSAPLAFVSPLPRPSLPADIAQIAPVGKVSAPAQIRVIFAHPALPVSELGTPAERAVLARFSLTPALAGRFVVLTPRMVGFEPDAPLPPATRVRVSVDRLAWTFTTQPLRLRNADVPADPQPTPAPTAPTVGLSPVLHVESNAPLDLDSFAQHAHFLAPGGARIDVTASLQTQPSPQPSALPIYDVRPLQQLHEATAYALVVSPGVMPAYGNLPTSAALRIPIVTRGPLAFAYAQPTSDPDVYPASSRFAAGDPSFAFSNALDPASLAGNITIAPSPAPVGKLVMLSYDAKSIFVNPYALAPNANYIVTFAKGLRDVFGQSLGTAARVALRTGNVAPAFWAPSGSNTFISTQNLQLQYNATNLPANRYRSAYAIVKPADMVYTDSAYPSDYYSLLPPVAAWHWHPVSGAKHNAQATVAVPLRSLLHAGAGMLAYGAGANLRNQAPSYGLVALTNLGIFTQWFPGSGYVMVARLSDGAPVSDAHVDVYVSHLYEKPMGAPQPCATGTTGADGWLHVDGIAIQRCYIGNRPADQAPDLLVVVRKGADWSYVRSCAYCGIYDYNVNGGWSAGQPISRGTIYSDREMYQPGEHAWLTAVCYVLQNGALRADRDARFTIELRDPLGNMRKLPPQKTDAFATFSFPLQLARSQPLGYYDVIATGPEGVQITGSFRVAEFRPPNFSVSLALDRSVAAAGATVTANAQARYLFGAPMNGASATLHVTRQPMSFTPKGWDEYTFGRQWFWPQEQPEVAADVSAQTMTLDAQGKAQARIAVPSHLPFAMTYRADVEVSDVTHLASAATQSFTALPSAVLIGLKTPYVGTAGTPNAIGVIVTDAAGNLQSGTSVHLELQKMIYSGVTQIVAGGEAARNQVQFKTVADANVTSAGSPQTVSLTANDSGSYRVRATIAGDSSGASETDAQIWISGPGQPSWAQQNPSQLQMKLDRQSYRAGETATLAIASPYRRADLYVSVVRDRVLYKTKVTVSGGTPRVRIPIASAFFPNAAVEAVLVRRGPALTTKTVREVDSLVRIGMVPLAIDLRPQYLRVTIAPQYGKIEPGARQRVRLTLRDDRGRAVRGEFTIIVANDAVLQLSGYRPPDLVKTVYADQPISVRFADNRPNVTLAQPAQSGEKGWGYGGGFLAGAAGTRVRTVFVPLAYFAGAVRTGADGSANVAFTLPDNLTTWRVMAVASTAGERPRFGAADTTFITTKPLVTQAMLPEFARTGDRIDAGLSLLNATGAAADATTEAALRGSLRFASNASTLRATRSASAGLNAWRFPMIVDGTGPAEMEFRTQLGAHRDAFRVPLQIRDQDVTEATIDSGATEGSARIPVVVGSAPAEIVLTLAGSLLPQALVPARQALASDMPVLLGPLADRLRIDVGALALQRKMRVKSGTATTIADARTSAAAIEGLQRLDGGFGYWPDAGISDPSGSAQAVEALAGARAEGIEVGARALERAKPYLVRTLADPHGALRWCTHDLCKAQVRFAMLQALAALGDRRTDFLQAINAMRASLGAATKMQLARYLQQTPGWRAQSDALWREIEQQVYLTGRYASAPADAQAAYLQLLVARGAPAAQRDRALAALLAQRCRCGWPSPAQTADALAAIAAYASAQGPSNFGVEVLVDGKPRQTVRIDAATPSQTVRIDARSLGHGRHTIALRKSGAGRLHYVLLYSYRLGASAPGRIAGLRVERTIRPVNSSTVLDTLDLAPMSKPLAFAAGTVYDIGVEVIADHRVDGVLLTDPLPAGFEAIDTSFLTTPSYYQPLAQSWQIDYEQIYRDRVVAFASHLDPGVYTFHYLARSVTPGTYLWPGARAHLVGAPEEFGRTAFATVTVGE